MSLLSASGAVVPLILSIVLQSVTAGYVITIPRKWVSGSRTQICLAMDSPPGPNDRVTITLLQDLLLSIADGELIGLLPGLLIGLGLGNEGFVGGLLGGGLDEQLGVGLGGFNGGIGGALGGGNEGGPGGGLGGFNGEIGGGLGEGNEGGPVRGLGGFNGEIGGELGVGLGGFNGEADEGLDRGLGRLNEEINGKFDGEDVGEVQEALKRLSETLSEIFNGLLTDSLNKRIDSNTTASLLSCEDFQVPDGLAYNGYSTTTYAFVNGSIGGVSVVEEIEVEVIRPVGRVFVQTDKELYKAGQIVQFRVLTIEGVYLNVSTEPYPEIFVESPSGSRIAQWLNVPNPSGLIHRELQLYDEAEEGSYRIVVKAFGSFEDTYKFFRVEDYVLPRFEVTVTLPTYVIATDEILELKVCAQYTFGQPVRGNVSVNVKIDSYFYYTAEVEENFIYELIGCGTFEISLDEFNINDPEVYVYSLRFKITVEEAGTGEEVEEEAYILITRSVLTFSSLPERRSAKPNLPYPFITTVSYLDGEPAANEPFSACAGEVCGNFTTDEFGVLRVVYLPPPSVTYPTIWVVALNYPELRYNESTTPYMYRSETFFGVQKYVSPSNSSLFINPDVRYLSCTWGNSIVVTLPVLYASEGVSETTLYVQAVSRGQVQFWKSLEVQFTATELPFEENEILGSIEAPASNSTIRGVFYLTLDLPPTVSHVVNVIIWYTRPDGEVVSDEERLEIAPCLNYPVELSWPTDTVEQGTELPLTLTAQPNSLCSLGIVDKSVALLSATQNSLLGEIFQLIDSANTQYWEVSSYATRYCRIKNEEPMTEEEPVFGIFIGERNEASISSSRLRSGLIPGSNPGFFPFFFGGSNYVDAMTMFEEAGLIAVSDQILETLPCIDTSNGFPGLLTSALLGGDGGVVGFGGVGGSAGLEMAVASPGLLSTPEAETRSYFPETWLWELLTIPDTGVYSETRTLPDTITEWVGDVVCVHPEMGIGISSPASITTFRTFFIDLTLPPSVKVGEILPVKISVFNYLNTSIPVRINLEESSEYEILDSDSAEAAADQAAAGERGVCIPTQDKDTVVVRIRPLTAGSVAINVSAVVDSDIGGQCGSGTVRNGFDRISKPITVDYEGFPREKTWTSFICSDDSDSPIWYLEAPTGIVNNSDRAWITVAGDLLGPTLDNLQSLIRMPYGCGEQNMITFTPNIYVMQYLEASNQANDEVTQQLLRNMRSGYQRELTYKRSDGSYSCFGDQDDSGSTWLTAFVLKSYAQAMQYIDVDFEELLDAAKFLRDLQSESGCFKSVGYVFSKRLNGGVGASGTPGTLTAYVLAAMLEAGAVPSSPEIVAATSCIKEAAEDNDDDTYFMALQAYAYSLAGLPETEDVINDLLSRSTQNSAGLFWDMRSVIDEYSDALSVETSSYVLLAMLNSDFSGTQGEVLQIVKWISSRRNGQGGFVSTQDTVLALQALALYQSRNSELFQNLTVTASGESLNAVFQVTESNSLLTQRADVDVVPNKVAVDLMGSGCALVQAVVRYNVPDPDLSEVFSLRVTTSYDFSHDICQAHNIEICATYLLNDGESNMGIIEISLVSGFVPDIEDLERIVNDVTGSIKRYEVEDGKVFFYIDQFTDTETCVKLTAYEETEVEDARPGTVKIYDYYEPDFFISETYTFRREIYCRS